MIRGTVNAARRVMITVVVVDQTGLFVDVQAAIDTGFSGYLILPPDLITALHLPYIRTDSFTLGDNSVVRFDVHATRVSWDGLDKDVGVLSAEGTPLVGMALLEGSDLFISVAPGGEVRIERRP